MLLTVCDCPQHCIGGGGGMFYDRTSTVPNILSMIVGIKYSGLKKLKILLRIHARKIPVFGVFIPKNDSFNIFLGFKSKPSLNGPLKVCI